MMMMQEINQNKNMIGISEIIRNINYTHSLTVMYHNILRYLRMDTKFTEIKKYLFISFFIKFFTINRIYK
jgi:hypothetical protein